MAGSRFEYVRSFERDVELLPQTWLVVRVDGRGWGKLSTAQGWTKPCDARAAGLCASAACAVLADFGDCVLAYGQSDEFSFVFPPRAAPYGRRAYKLASSVASVFSASLALRWATFFPPPALPLASPPSVDARVVAYPSLRAAADYCRWRQVDCYINAMYNEAFWALRRAGADGAAAHAALLGTTAQAKHDILHAHGLNFARLPAAVRRGTTLVRTAPQQHARPTARWLLTGEEVPGSEVGSGGRVDASLPLPDTDAGMDMGPLALPSPALTLCFPDFCKGAFLERALADTSIVT